MTIDFAILLAGFSGYLIALVFLIALGRGRRK